MLDINDVAGATYDEATGQIILFGKEDISLPQMDVDDLAVAVNSVYSNQDPGVSIGTEPSEYPGWMKVRYDGATIDTEFGKVMFDADRLLKCLDMGYDNVTRQPVSSSVSGYQNMITRELYGDWTGGGQQVAERMWFKPKDMKLTKNTSGDAMVFSEVTMELLTEATMQGSVIRNPEGEAFASHFTNHYDEFASEFPVLKELKRLGKITSVVKWVKDNNIPLDMSFFNDYQIEYAPCERYTPEVSVTGTRSWTEGSTTYTRTVTLTGGVSYEPPNEYLPDNPIDPVTEGLKDAAIAQRPSEETFSWNFQGPPGSGGQAATLDTSDNFKAVSQTVSKSRKDGNFETQRIDMSFPVTGEFNLELVRYYNSFNEKKTGFGYGWSPEPFEMRFPGEKTLFTFGTSGYQRWCYHKINLIDRMNNQEDEWTLLGIDNNNLPLYSREGSSDLLRENGDGTFVLNKTDKTSVDFNAGGRITALKDKNNNTINFNYSSGRLSSISHPSGRAIALTYNIAGKIERADGPGGRAVTYNYDAQGDLAQANDIALRPETYGYNADHQITTVTDKRTNPALQNTYDIYNRATEKVIGGDAGFISDFSLKDRKTITTGPGGIQLEERFDVEFRPVERKDALKNLTQIEYEGDFGPKAIKDGRGLINQYKYDIHGNVTEVKNDKGETIKLYYDYKDNLIARTDPQGFSQVYMYDDNNNLVTIYNYALLFFDDTGNLTSYSYDPENISTINYDASGNPFSIRDAEGNIQNISYDPNGMITGIEKPSGLQITQVYDVQSRLSEIRDPAGHNVVFGYDNADNMNSVTTSAGTVNYEYDPNDNLKKIRDGMTRETQFGYDAKNNTTSVLDAKNNTTSYAYDVFNNLTSANLPNQTSFRYMYDENNRKIAMITGYSEIPPEPEIATFSSAIDFGRVDVGTSLTKTVTIYNIGLGDLLISNITANNPVFTTNFTGPIIIPGGESRDIIVTFTPVTEGPATATLTITNNDIDEGILLISLTGSAGKPSVHNLEATAGPNGITLTWAPYNNTAGTFDHYNIYRSTSSFTNVTGMAPLNSAITDVNTVTFADGDAQSGIQYYYAVTIVDTSGIENKEVEAAGPIVYFFNFDYLGDGFFIANDTAWELSSSIAYNSVNNEYLVVYERREPDGINSDIKGQRFSADGALIGGTIDISSFSGIYEYGPDIVYNQTRNEYFVVYLWYSTADSKYLVAADRISASGVKLTSGPIVIPYAYNQNNPSVAYNSTTDQYLVTCELDVFNNYTDLDVVWQVMSGSGDRVGDLNGWGYSFHERQPDIAYNSSANEYYVVFEGSPNGESDFDIFGFRVNADATLSDGNLYYVGGFLNIDEANPCVVYNSANNKYLSAFEVRMAIGEPYEHFYLVNQHLTATGEKTGGWNFISYYVGIDEKHPALAYNPSGNEYLAVFDASFDGVVIIPGRRISSTGSLIGGIVVGAYEFNPYNPAIAYNSSDNQYTVSMDYNLGSIWDPHFDIIGQRVGPESPVLHVEPSSLTFSELETTKEITITNTGDGTLDWGVYPDHAWMTANPKYGNTTIETDPVTISVNRAGLAPGTYNVFCDIHSDAGDIQLPVSVVVENTNPNIPGDPAPQDGASNQSGASQELRIALSWTGGDPNPGDIVRYDVYLSKTQILVESKDPSALLSLSQAPTSYTTQLLDYSSAYYWRIVAKDDKGGSVDGPVWSFTTKSSQTPTLTPVMPDPTNNSQPALDWYDVAGATKYHIQIDDALDFNSPIIDDANVIASVFTPQAVLPEGTIYWRVSSIDSQGTEGPFSNPDVFFVDLTLPAQVSLVPYAPDPTRSQRPVLAWNAISDASSYHLQISSSSNFSLTLVDRYISAATQWVVESDLPEGIIWWRVSAKDLAGNEGIYSPADSFTIDLTPPQPITVTSADSDFVRFTVTWAPFSNTAGDFNHFNIYRENSQITNVSGLIPIDQSITNSAAISFIDSAAAPNTAYYYAVTAVDNAGNENKNVVSFGPVSLNGNTPPFINPAIPDISVPKNTPITVDLSPYKHDNEDPPASLIWSVSGVNESLLSASIAPSTDLLTITPVTNTTGSDNITFTLTDSGGLIATDTITIIVSDFTPPTVDYFRAYDTDSSSQIWTNSRDVGIEIYESSTGSGIGNWLINESASQPLTTDFSLTTRPSGYHIEGSEGQVTIYAWVKDGNNNISVLTGSSIWTINLDLTQPELNANATAIDATHIEVTYDEPVISADNVNNYSAQGLVINSVVKISDTIYRVGFSQNQAEGANYTIAVSNITDRAGNLINPANNAVSFRGFDNSAPIFAGLASAAPQDTSIILSWNPATDPTTPVKYNIYQSNTSGGQIFSLPNYVTYDTRTKIAGLFNGQEYFFVVRAEDAAGNEDTNVIELSASPTANVNSWALSGLSGQTVQCLALDETAPSNIYAGTLTSGIYRSTDSGQTWQQDNTGLTELNIEALAIDPASHLILYAGSGTGTADSWSAWSEPLTNPAGSAITSPLATYIQYKANLSTGNPNITPQLSNNTGAGFVTITYSEQSEYSVNSGGLLDGTKQDVELAGEALQLGTSTDTQSVLLLHLNGENNQTTSIDSSISNHPITFNGNAHLDGPNAKFGLSSLALDGNGDYISLPDSADWSFGTGDFTIDFWVKFAALPSDGNGSYIISQWKENPPRTNEKIHISLYNNFGSYVWRLLAENSTSNAIIDLQGAATLNLSTWYHVAIVRNGNTFNIYQDGVSVGSVIDPDGFQDGGSNFYIGSFGSGTSGYLNGWIDELRISKGMARWTGNFTPPGTEYGGIYKTQGAYISNPIELDALGLDRILWNETLPSGTDLTIQTRTGNSPNPDDGTWNGWSLPLTDPAGSAITSAPGRYIQYKVNLSTNDASVTPALTPDVSGNYITIAYVKYYAENLDNGASGIKENAELASLGTVSQSDSLFLHLNGADSSISSFDSSIHNHPLTFNGNAHLDGTNTKFGLSSLALDGITSYLTVPDSGDWAFGAGDLTVDLWVKFSSVSDERTIFCFGDTGNIFELRWVGASNSWQLVLNGASAAAWSDTISTDTWYHIALVRSAGNFKLFKSGLQIGADYASAYSIPQKPLTIGSDYSHTGRFFNGWIDEVRISTGIARWTSDFIPLAPVSTLTLLSRPDIQDSLLLHLNGDNNQNTTVDSSTVNHPITFNGNARLDSFNAKFGSSSLALDGTNSYLTAPASADWDFGTGDFTIDFWVRLNSASGQCFVDRGNSSSFTLRYGDDANLKFEIGGAEKVSQAWSPNIGQWYHLAFVRGAAQCYIFVDGLQLGAAAADSSDISSPFPLYVGRIDGYGGYLNGYIDELRISKGVARWTSSFTPPGSENRTYETAGAYTSNPIGPGVAQLNTISWNELLPPGTDITIQTRTTDTLSTGPEAFGTIYRKTAGWDTLRTGLGNAIKNIAISPSDSNIIYAATWGEGLLRTGNGGVSWNNIGPVLTDNKVNAVLVRKDDPSIIYIGTESDGIYKSNDGALNFNPINTGLANLSVKSLAIDPKAVNILYAGTASGIYKSTDSGANWQRQSPTVITDRVNAIVIDGINTDIVYAGTEASGVYRSTTGGESWAGFNNGLLDLSVTSIAIDQKHSSLIWCATKTGGLFKIVKRNSPPQILSVAVAPLNAYTDSTLVATPSGWSDPDLDTEGYSYEWHNQNGIILGAASSQLTGNYFAKGDGIYCRVKPYDGFDYGNTVDSNHVTILNSLPAIGSASISPVVAYKTAPVIASGIGWSDPDGDIEGYTYEWRNQNGLISGVTGNTLDPAYFNKHDTIYCIVAPFDGEGYGAPKTSGAIQVENSPPQVNLIRPDGGESLKGISNIEWSAQDADSDTVLLSLFYKTAAGEWIPIASGEANDGTYGWDTSALPDGFNNYFMKVTAADGEGEAVDISTNPFTLNNQPPAPPANIQAALSGNHINVSWDRNSESDLAGYKVYHGSSTRNYTASTDIPGPDTTACQLLMSDVRGTSGAAGAPSYQGSAAPDAAPPPEVSNASPLSDQEYVRDELIVKLKNGVTSIRKLNTRLRVPGMKKVFKKIAPKWKSPATKTIAIQKKTLKVIPDLDSIYLIKLRKGSDVMALVKEYEKDPNVEYAEPNYKVHALGGLQSEYYYIALTAYDTMSNESPYSGEASVEYLPPDDVYYRKTGTWGQAYQDMWGLHKINIQSAWSIEKGTGNSVVAVVDTGCDYNHEDLSGNIWTNTAEIAGNGLDDDGNGFIDDTRGWDFIGANADTPIQDNNPIDGHGHGTHVAGTIAAVTDNYKGIAGISWGSKIMPVKMLDDSGSGTSAISAQAIRYAADNGAKVLNNSWGGFGNSLTVKNAVDYAHSLGCVVVVAAGNENRDALYSNPSNCENAITVSAFDPLDKMAYFSNWGAKIDVAAPGVDILSLRASGTGSDYKAVGAIYYRMSGTSMACPHVAGLAALILSKNPALTNEEVRQIIRSSSFDLGPLGRDDYSGYGRIDAAAALGINSICISKINSPGFNTHISGTIDITGTAQGAYFLNYIIEYGRGDNPTEWLTGYITLTGGGLGQITDGILGALDTTNLEEGDWTIRLSVTDSGGITSKAHQTITVDRTLHPNWPKDLEYNDSSSPVYTDIDNNGSVEILLCTKSPDTSNGTVHVWNSDGTYKAGWPITINNPINSAPAAGDVDGDGYKEIIVLAYDPEYITNPGVRQHIFVFKHDGTTLSGWPKSNDYPSQWSSPVLADLNGDSTLDIIVCGTKGSGGRVYAYKADGTAIPGWPVDVTGKLESTPTVGDIDNDGEVEIIAVTGGTDAKAYAWHKNGIAVTGWPRQLDGYGSQKSSPALGDIDLDGILEVICGITDEIGGEGMRGKVYVLDGNGTNVPGWPQYTGNEYVESSPCLADLGNNGDIEIIIGSSYDQDGSLHVWKRDGTYLAGWPKDTGSAVSSSPIAVDVDGDGRNEVIAGTGPAYCKLYIWDMNGNELSGWPRRVDSIVLSSPAIGDTDGDGLMELLLSPWGGKIYQWDLAGNAAPERLAWPMFHGNAEHTGRYNIPNYAPTLSGIPDKTLGEDGALDNTIDLYQYAADINNPDTDLIFTINGNTNPDCGVAIDTNRYVDINPVSNWNGISDVTVRATDPRGLYVEDTIRITVNSINDTPVISPPVPDPAAVDEEAPLVINVTANEHDIEDSGIGLNWTVLGADSCAVLGENSPDNILTFMPQANYYGQDTVTLVLTDSGGATAAQDIILTWNPVNDPPVVGDIPDKIFDEGGSDASILLDNYAEDADNLAGEIGWTYSGNTNINVFIDPVSHIVNFSSAVGWNGQETIMFTARDPGGLTASDTVTVTVNALYGSVSGAVRGAPGSLPLENVWVRAYDWDTGALIDSAQTRSDGTYNIIRLIPGNYRIYADSTGTDHVSEYYNGAKLAAGASKITVVLSTNAANIDLDLPLTENISFEAEDMDSLHTTTTVIYSQAESWAGAHVTNGLALSGENRHTFYVPKAGEYTVWLRLSGEATSQGVLEFDINQGRNVVVGYDAVGNPPYPSKWVNWENNDPASKTALTLNEGKNILSVRFTQPNVKLDSIIITNDFAYVPADVPPELVTADWTQVVGNGFGDVKNHEAKMTACKGNLYISTSNTNLHPAIYKSEDGKAFTKVFEYTSATVYPPNPRAYIMYRTLDLKTLGLGTDAGLYAISDDWYGSCYITTLNPDGTFTTNRIGNRDWWTKDIISFHDLVYAGFYNDWNLWFTMRRTATPMSPDAKTAWLNVSQAAFGKDPATAKQYANMSAESSCIFKGYLYIGTYNRGYFGRTTSGAQIWRTNDGMTWEGVMLNGFGSVNRSSVSRMTVFGGYLYATTAEAFGPNYIYRSRDGVNWELAYSGMSSEPYIGDITPFMGRLYLTTYNWGGRVYSSADGQIWSAVSQKYIDNNSANSLVGDLFSYRGYLYVNTRNMTQGTNIFRAKVVK